MKVPAEQSLSAINAHAIFNSRYIDSAVGAAFLLPLHLKTRLPPAERVKWFDAARPQTREFITFADECIRVLRDRGSR